MKGLWFTELQTKQLALSLKIKQSLHHEVSEFQEISMVDTYDFGRMLLLDGIVMTTIKDEFVYHEMISLPALNTHPNPLNVLVIGGGDGGVIREIIKHPKVEKATLCEIDGRVIEVSKKYLPEISGALGDPKVEVLVADGIKHIQESKNRYDVICVDSTDPIGPAVGLFAKDFYQGIYEALKDDGLFVAQTESPWVNEDLIKRVYGDISDIFPITRLYLASIPTYPTGLWSFTMGSKKYDPIKVEKASIPNTNTKYYTPDIHLSAFNLPTFVQNILG
ncbi:MAG: spermidine synthase [Peptococcaceae bacterium BICA1-8]|nr:MAG: spermidine synthase [Peptococcaceae bacterium BICA1-8]